ncbi:MAG: cobalt transporter CbiM [Bacillota bacterium]|nr:cobalt transporter CbiM [Bacillota bacterium]
MHIPDGYLSVQTSVPAFGAMVPVWTAAVRKLKKTMELRQVPLVSLCAAFAFVIMMFNVPIGPSSVHAIGAVFIAVLIGPWASCLSITVALVIQALVFGDGGILALGANCFNMAFVMPFAGYYIFRFLKGKADIISKRGMFSVFIASYVGINLAALFTAIEFGIQPLLFKTASGTPLYGFFPLWVSIPAIMSEHLLIAGPIEGLITVSAIAYIARFNPKMIVRTTARQSEMKENISFFKRYKAILIAFGIIAVLTPLGMLATGTAWGEWSTGQIKNMVGYVPKGLSKLSGIWKSLFPGYSLDKGSDGFLGSSLGYLLCAIIGIIIIAALMLLINRLILGKRKLNSEKNDGDNTASSGTKEKQEAGFPEWMLVQDSVDILPSKASKTGFLKRTMNSVSKFIQNDLLSERYARKEGFVQSLDVRVKLVFILFYMVFTGITGSLALIIATAVFSVLLAAFSKLEMKSYFKRVWLVFPLIIFVFSIPAATNILISGKPLLFIYKGVNTQGWLLGLPGDLYFSIEGVTAVLKTVFRIGTCISFGYLLVMTTGWSRLTGSFSFIKVPALVTSMLDMTYRYIFVLTRLTINLFESRFQRTVGKISGRENRKFISGGIAYLFVKSSHISEETYNAMIGRGYDGKSVCLEVSKIKRNDLLFTAFNLIAISIIIMGDKILGK